MILKIAALAAYVSIIFYIAVTRGKKTRSFNDFFLGGGAIGPWMTAFTYGAAYFSAVLFIGFAGKIGWGFGYSGLWIAVGNAFLGVLGVWWIMGARIKKTAGELKIATMAEYLERRYDSRFLKLFASVSIFVFFIPYSAAVFIGLSTLFKRNFGLDYVPALLFMGVLTAVYLVLGGYKSMTMMDVMFGILMLVGGGVMLIGVLSKTGGIAAATTGLNAINPKLTAAVGPPGLWPLFSLVFLTSVAPFGMPQLVQKFYAVKDKRSIRIGMIVSTAFALVLSTIAYFTGSVARLFLSPEAVPAVFPGGKPDFDALMPELLSRIVPEGLSILILLLILSASMSTLAALVLISSSAVAKDFYAGFINPQVSDRTLMTLMRVFSAAFVFVSVVLAYFRPATIVSILGISWGAIGSVFLGPFVWGILSKKVNRNGAIISSVLGLAVCLFLYLRGMASPEAGTIGMLVSLAANPIFSLIPAKRIE
ncbi:MAG: sodium/solute symporter [Candidatus Aminicenantes bacterium]|nr:sodium/solute symporter [Candidatus Aminicenantes bacterium]